MWMRRVEVRVFQKDDPSKQTIFKSHRIDFAVRSTVGWPADTADITLYNLSLDEIKFLQSKNYGEMYIEIRAAYADSASSADYQRMGGVRQVTTSAGQKTNVTVGKAVLPTIFSGIITNAVGYRRPPEHITQLFCISKAYGSSTDFKQMKAIPKGASLQSAIRSMCEDYGFGTVSMYGVDGDLLNETLKLGRTFHDTFLIEFKKLLGEYNLMYTMTTGEIQIFPDSYGDRDAVDRMSKDREPIKLDANAVIGNPIAGICTYSLSTFLNPAIQPGMVLDVSPLLGKKLLANGVTAISGEGVVLNTDQSIFRWAMGDKYFIMDVVHHGSTHTKEYQTSLTANLGGNTAMGGREAAWQQLYANSGMSMEL